LVNQEKDDIPFKNFDEWLCNQAVFRAFAKKAVKKLKPYSKPTILNYFLRKEKKKKRKMRNGEWKPCWNRSSNTCFPMRIGGS
jgi:hypothetical protein